jgi:DNA helicase-2/ATP-dependent DNA helicase PcrA
MSSEHPLLSRLTEPQVASVMHQAGPLLVLAGPGSGKTTVVTRRIAMLLDSGVPPWSILALTFTNKAAGEMRQRVQNLVGAHEARGVTISTFHSFSAMQLRTLGDRVGAPDDFTIYDTSDQRSAVKEAIAEAGLDTSNWPPASVLGAISQAKNALCGPDEFERNAGDFYSRSMARIYRTYQNTLTRCRALDFDDLLRLLAVALRDNATLRADMGGRYRFLLVDEYQDTNHAQFVIASAIASVHRNICVVGDPDQSIYAWRGADITNILEFETRYDDAVAVSLGENFRSTANIVTAAAGLIRHNESHRAREFSTSREDGDKPIIQSVPDEHAEAKDVVERLSTWRSEHELAWSDMAVLYRLNAQSRVLEEAFRRAEVPYVVARGTAFYDRREVKDALCYLRLLLNERDDVALRRIINVPTRGIGKTSLDKVERLAAKHDVPLMEAIGRCREIDSLTARARTALLRFVSMIDSWRQALGGALIELSLEDLVARVLEESGLEGAARTKRGEEDLDRLANLQELVSAAADRAATEADAGNAPHDLRGRLAAWLESIALISDADAVDPTQGAVTLMTLHAAKGLEFECVAIVGCEQGVLPHARAGEDPAGMEEERRLCYVGMTRAKGHLLMTHASVRSQRGRTESMVPSRFLDEIPADSVRVLETVDPWTLPSAPLPEVIIGQAVRHPRFGVGIVMRFGRRGAGRLVTVDFEQYGPRTMPASHASLEPLSQEYGDL